MSDKFYEDITKRLELLAGPFNNLGGGVHDLSISAVDASIPRFRVDNLRSDYAGLKDLDSIDESVFATWKTADIPFMLAAGTLGAFSSAALKDFFDGLHQKWGSKPSVKDNGKDVWGHGGQNIDKVPDSKRPGGWGHRWKFGHDLFNPWDLFKAVDPLDPSSTPWNEYLKLAEQSGTILPPWMKAIYYWLSHLLQDTFSAEGLPLPGHSLLRGLFDPAKNHELLQFLGTIKMRDVAGTGVTNLIMGGYLWGTEHKIKRVLVEPNYRAFSLMLGANWMNLTTGLFIPPPKTTLNYSAIPVIAYYAIRLYKMEKRLGEALRKRDVVLEENERTISHNLRIIAENGARIDTMICEMEKFESEIDEDIRKADAKQEALVSSIFNSEKEG